MNTETKFRAGLAMTLLGLAMMTFKYFEKDRVYQELKVSSSTQIDSLRDENFILNVELGRNDLTWEYVKEKFPNVYDNAMNFKSHETE
jgi:hypothetical protein